VNVRFMGEMVMPRHPCSTWNERRVVSLAHDNIRAQPYEKEAANLSMPPSQGKRQNHKNGDRRMDWNPEPLKGHSSAGLYDGKRGWWRRAPYRRKHNVFVQPSTDGAGHREAEKYHESICQVDIH
jgi:hypothetical protein